MPATLTQADRGELLAMARRHARGRIEAEDLLQDALLAALAAGRRDGATDRAWLAGVMRNLSRMAGRSATRRRRRETVAAFAGSAAAEPAEPRSDVRLDDMPRSLRIVAMLALSGHTRTEIRYLLGISDEALRQRISAVKRHLAMRGEPVPAGLPGLRGALAFGAIRRGLLPIARRLDEGFATHDPDGYPIVFGRMRLPPHKTGSGGNRQA